MASIIFDEGADYIATNGIPAKVFYALSTKPTSGAGSHKVTDTRAGGFGEITGTGYTREEATVAAASGSGEGERSRVIEEKGFATGAATNWESAKSKVICTAAGGSGVLLYAEDLTATRVLGQAGIEEKVQSTFKL